LLQPVSLHGWPLISIATEFESAGAPVDPVTAEPIQFRLELPPWNIGRGPDRRSFPGCSESPTARTVQGRIETMGVVRRVNLQFSLFRESELLGR
jgi:L-rhamnose isomerase